MSFPIGPRVSLSTWHLLRRLTAAATAGFSVTILERQGMPFLLAILCGVGLAVVVGSLIIPAIWKPPLDEQTRGDD